MANIINTIIENQAKNIPVPKSQKTYTTSTAGQVQPYVYKGEVLPSRIFGSPLEYAKDLKDDFVSIKSAVKGDANDHQLGRINDLAMKMGSLALASYLFVKNPLKLSKAMEYAGFGTFFASMALWPKLAIQLPIKARTGVDIHQKYIDTQGRKKKIHQDPQYDLTDIYSREDLDRMGKGLGVAENLPDRDDFIKQRVKKTAIQGNTLWMLTAGLATPLMSALGCNVLEKPISNIIEKRNLAKTGRAVQVPEIFATSSIMGEKLKTKMFSRFLKLNANKPLNNEMISNLAEIYTRGVNSASVRDGIKKELEAFRLAGVLSKENVINALEGKFDFSILDDKSKEALEKAIAEGKIINIANILANAAGKKGKAKDKFAKDIAKTLTEARKNMESSQTVGEVSNKLVKLYGTMRQFAKDKKVLDTYIDVRAGNKSGTYIANHWQRVSDEMINSLLGKRQSFISDKKLKALANGDYELLSREFNKIAKEGNYDKVVKRLMKLVQDYEKTAGETFIETVADKASNQYDGVFTKAANNLKKDNFMFVADVLSSGKDSVENAVKKEAKESVIGAGSSLYRLLQTLDVYKKINQGTLQNELKSAMESQGQTATKESVDKLVGICRKMLLTMTTTDNIEKLKSAGFNLSESEYKVVMDVLYNPNIKSTVAESLEKRIEQEEVNKLLRGFNEYKANFRKNVANWRNGMTPELSRRTIESVEQSANAIEKNGLVGKSVQEFMKDAAKNRLNSNKWMKIFGGAMIALTLVTVGATFAVGRKGKTEKQIESGKKVNG